MLDNNYPYEKTKYEPYTPYKEEPYYPKEPYYPDYPYYPPYPYPNYKPTKYETPYITITTPPTEPTKEPLINLQQPENKLLVGWKPAIYLPNGNKIILKETYDNPEMAELRLQHILKENPKLNTGEIIKGTTQKYTIPKKLNRLKGFKRIGNRVYENRNNYKQENSMDILGLMKRRTEL